MGRVEGEVRTPQATNDWALANTFDEVATPFRSMSHPTHLYLMIPALGSGLDASL